MGDISRLLAGNGIIKLGERSTWKIADIRRIGSHDRQTKTFVVTPVRMIADGLGGRTRDLVLNEDIILQKKSIYYFGDKYNHFMPAVKKNLQSHFPKEHNNLTSYLKENKVKFDRKEDIEKIVQYIAQKN
jgi:hypothetical protein